MIYKLYIKLVAPVPIIKNSVKKIQRALLFDAINIV